MKHFFSLVILVLSSSNIFACSCSNQGVDINNFFITSKYVAYVQIMDVENSPTSASNFHTVQVKTLQKFKGKDVSEIKVLGNTGHGIVSCTLTPGIDEYWVIFGVENAEGIIEISYCSGSKELKEQSYLLAEDRWIDNNYSMLTESLSFLSIHAETIQRDFYVLPSTGTIDFIKNKYNDTLLQSNFGQYLLTFDEDLNVVEIKTLKRLGQSFDKDFTTFLKKYSEWTAVRKNKNARHYSHLLGIYHDEETNSLSLGALYSFY